MRALTVLIVGAVCGGAALAQSAVGPFDSDAFGADQRGSLPRVPTPASFTLLMAAPTGSSVTYRTHLPARTALDEAAAALGRDGWSESSQPVRSPFITPDTPITRTFCRGNEALGVSVVETPDTTQVSYRLPPLSINNGCGDALNRDPMARMRALQGFMPTLEFPRRRTAGERGFRPLGMSGGGSDRSYRSSTQVAADESAGGLADHLAAQLFEQGWQLDASWSGAVTAGSTWTSQPDRQTRLSGTLSVVHLGDSTYDVEFRIVLLN